MIMKLRRFNKIGTVLLCVGLTLNLNLWAAGCGGMGVPTADLLSGPSDRIALNPRSALKRTLIGSPFEGATALVFDPDTQQFGLELPGIGQRLEGRYAILAGETSITDLALISGDLRLSIFLDADRHVVAMETASGLRWTRPASWQSGPSPPESTGLDAYLSANRELLDFARAMDSALGGGSASPPGQEPTPPATGSPGTKSDPAAQAAGGDLSAILNTLGAILVVQGVIANLPAVIWVFQVMVSVQVTMSLVGAMIELPPADNTIPTVPPGMATLRVTNSLSDGRPIWFVSFALDDGTTGPDMLDGQAIPAGESRDFAVITGVRDVDVRVPSGKTCFVEYVRKGRRFVAGQTEEVVITDEDSGELTPEGCDDG
ncbi:MAG: hypothetical protein ACE5EC_08365 [Phycisphaerae bacterium]